MPGSLVWASTSTALAPLDYHAVLATSLVLHLVAGLLFFVLLRRLFGRRWAILVPLAVFLFSTLTLPGTWWWTAALVQGPVHIAILLALLAQDEYLRTGRRLLILAAPVYLALGLSFSPRALLALPLMLVVAWLSAAGAELSRSAWARRHVLLWLPLLAVAVPYGVLHAIKAPTQPHGDVTLNSVLELFVGAVRETVLPGLLGGPWRWEAVGPVDSVADAHVLAQVGSAIVAGVVVILSMRRGAVAINAWIAALLFLLGLVVLTAFSPEFAVLGTAVIRDPLPFAEFALVASLCGAFAWIPVTPDRPPRSEPSARTAAASFFGAFHIPSALAAVTVAFVLGSFYSTYLLSKTWGQNPAASYVSNARESMRDLSPGEPLHDAAVPEKVVPPLLSPANLPSRIFGPLGLRAITLRAGESTSVLRQFDRSGRLRDSHVDGIGPAVFETPDCLVEIGGKTKKVPLGSRTFDWPWVIQIDYEADKPGEVQITAGSTQSVIQVDPAVTRMYIAVEGSFNSVTMRAPDNAVCIKYMAVGEPQPNGE
ncbi:MAG: hypothetical protein M3Q98_02655 [Actinomycetota bacterium]|nr:hypothetical protein [Actinomycetota bacterium]